MLNAIAARLDALLGASDEAGCLAEFHRAIRQGRHDDALNFTLQHPGLVRMADAAGYTALHWAALGWAGLAGEAERQAAPRARDPGCHVVIAARLLELGADPQAINDRRETPLCLAIARARDVTMARLLLERRANPMAADSRGNTALHLAVQDQENALELARLVRRFAGCQALGATNRRGRTPYDLVVAHSPGPLRDALLTELCDTSPPRPPDPVHPDAAPPHEPPWAIAMRMLRADLQKAESDPARTSIKAIFWKLPTIVKSLPAIAQRDDAAALLATLLGDLGDLIARCGRDELLPAMNLLRGMGQAAPGLIERQPLAWFLHLRYAHLWRRAGRLPEAISYADRARELAARLEDASAVAEIGAELDDELDAIELGALQAHLQTWAAAVLSDFQAALHDMEAIWRDTDNLIDAMQSAAADLRAIGQAHRYLLRHGAPNLAQGFAELPRYMGAPALRDRLSDALSVARQTRDKGLKFRALAAAVLAFARASAWHGLAGYAAAWCAAVANAVVDRGSTKAVRAYPCGDHLAMAEQLQLTQYGTHAAREAPAAVAPPTKWRAFRQALAALRERTADDVAALPPYASPADPDIPLPVEALQQKVTAELVALIGTIISSTLEPMLIDPPIPFAVLGLGSMSRGDMGPYSDVEYVVVVAEPLQPGTLAHAWFARWRALFEFAVFTLGESSPGGDHPFTARKGLYLDAGAAAIAAQEAPMETPDALAERVRQRHLANRDDKGQTDLDVAFSLLTPCLAYGSPALASAYAAAMTRMLDERQPRRAGAPCTARQDLALRQLHADIRHLETARKLDPALVDLKRHVAGPLNHALTILALLYGYGVHRPREILAQLALSRRFAPGFLADYRRALATVQTIRMRTHLRHGCHQDEIAWDALAPEDAAALRAVEARVVRPLWAAFDHWLRCHDYARKGPSAVLQALLGLADFDPAMLGFEPDPEPTARRAASPTTEVMPEAVESLVATLVHRQTDAATLTEFYGLSMSRMARSRYMETWRIWREGLATRTDADALMQALAPLPCGDGWRGAWADAERIFHEHVGSWLGAADPPPAGMCEILLRDMSQEPHRPARVQRYALRPEIAAQLFRPDGTLRPKPDGQHGRHTLLPVRFESGGEALTYWVKIEPENAPMETLVHALDRRINGGSGTPCSMVCRLQSRRVEVAALVMEGADDGHGNLEALMGETPSILRDLDRASFTRALLRVMITNPEDDKADDYFARRDGHGRVHLRRVDNERAFFPPEESRFIGANRLLVKTVLYCAEAMYEPLDTAVLHDFCKLAPVRLVQSWLVEAQMLHAHYRELFTDAEMRAHLNKRDMAGLLTVAIADGLEQELVKRIESIQGVVELGRRDGTPVTGVGLLGMVHRELARHYEHAFRALPVDPRRPDATRARFHLMTSSGYAVNAHGERRSEMAAIHAISRSLNVGTQLGAQDVCAIANGERLSPAQALARLRQMELHRVHDIVAGVLMGRRADRLRFSSLPARHRAEALAAVHAALLANPAAYTDEAQQRMLRVVAGVPFQELVLSGFAAVLTDAMLAPILRGAGESLRSIDISGCWQVTQDSMMTLAERCTQLRALRMRSLNRPADAAAPGLKALRKSILSIGILKLPQLRLLDTGGSLSLTTILIDAPRLVTLAIDGCIRLERVQTHSRELTTLDATGCELLGEKALDAITLAWPRMKTVRFDGCGMLKHGAYRARFPWTADLPWDFWSERQMVRWQDCLKAALAEMGESNLPGAMATRESLRRWLAARRDVAARMGDAMAQVPTLNAKLAIARALDANADGIGTVQTAASPHPVAANSPQPWPDRAGGAGASSSRSLRAVPNLDYLYHLDQLGWEHYDRRGRIAAAKKLGRLGAGAPAGVALALLKALTDRDEGVAEAAANALARIAIWPSPAELANLLREALPANANINANAMAGD